MALVKLAEYSNIGWPHGRKGMDKATIVSTKAVCGEARTENNEYFADMTYRSMVGVALSIQAHHLLWPMYGSGGHD
jgi:hypothetical protein